MELGIEHIIKLIDSRRTFLGISKKKLVKGICTVDMMSKIVNGQDRKLHKLEIDALLQRIGYNAKNCNCLLDIDEYKAFTAREHIREQIEKCYKDKNNYQHTKKMITEYKNTCKSNAELQAAEYFDIQLMCISAENNLVQKKKCMDAIKLTIDDFCMDNLQEYLYSEIEILIVTRLLRISADIGDRDVALIGYEKLLRLLGQDTYSNNESMKFFAGIIYDALLIYMERQQYEKVSALCRYAIEKMPRENKFRYLPEIYNMKAQADAGTIVSQKGYDEALFQLLYEQSAEYKIYQDLRYIPDKYQDEYYNDIKCPMYREYRIVFVGDIIRQRRMLCGMTQSELAYYINSDIKEGADEICSEKTLSRLGNGKTVTSWKVTRKLLERLKLPPERYFFDYVADDYSILEEISDIERCISAKKYEGLLERCEDVRKKNPLHYYPYNCQVIEKIEYKIKRINNIISGDDASRVLTRMLERTIPEGYLTDDSSIYMFMGEQHVLVNIVQNIRITQGENACLKLLEKMIRGYKDTCINEDVCTPYIVNLKRAYESYTANTGNLELACLLGYEVLREAIKHNMLGVLSPCLYDTAWNRAEANIKDDELRKMLKCVHTTSIIRCNQFLRELSEELYKDVIGDKIQ